MVIAIVDSGGHLVMLHHFDQAQHGSVVIAQEKARCAVNFKRATKLIEDAVAQGGLNLRMLAAPGVMPLEGGVPLIAAAGSSGRSGSRACARTRTGTWRKPAPRRYDPDPK